MPYDPETDVPKFGIGSIEYPTTVFERSSLAASNLLRGKLGATGRALLAPDSLTPTEAQDWKAKLLGKDPNPLLKTAVNIATNPLVVMGLITGFILYPSGSTKSLALLAEGMGAKAKPMGRLLGFASGGLSRLRGVGGYVGGKWKGMYSSIDDIIRDISGFKHEYLNDLDNIMKEHIAKHGKLSKEDLRVVGLISDSQRGGKNLIGRARDVKNPAMNAWFKANGYKKGDTLIRGLKDHPRGKALQSLSDRIRALQDKAWAEFPKEGEVFEEIRRRAGLKGETGLFQKGYGLPHYAGIDRYTHRTFFQRLNRSNFHEFVKDAEIKLNSRFYQDKAASIMSENAIRAGEAQGLIPRGLADAMAQDFARHSNKADDIMRGLWEKAKIKGGIDHYKVNEVFADSAEEYFKKGAGKSTNLGLRIGASKESQKGIFYNMAESISKAENTGVAKHIDSEFAAIGRVIGAPARYDTNVFVAATRYINNAASNIPWFGKRYTSGKTFDNILKQATKDVGAGTSIKGHTKSYIEDSIIPHLKGFKTWQQMQRTTTVNEWKHTLYSMVDRNLPKNSNTAKYLKDYFSDLPGSMSAEKLEHGIAGWTYASALGLNPAPVSKNALQTLATVINMPGMGPSSIWKGSSEVFKRMAGGTVKIWDDALTEGVGGFRNVNLPGFFKNVGGKVKHPLTGKMVSNFEAHFPEYVKAIGAGDDVGRAMARGDLIFEGSESAKYLSGGLKGKSDWVKDKMLWLFGKSETANRLSAFYAGQQQHLHHRALKKGAEITKEIMEEANIVGRNVVSAAHFTGGPLGMPSGTMNIAVPFKQFTHFPLRMADFLASSLHMGDDAILPALNRLGNWGTIGRATATAGIAYEAGKSLLGVDLSGGLGTGTLPFPAYEGAPFYPFPLVSPLVGAAGSLVQAAYKGDPSKLGATAAIMIPGGLAARRAYKTLAPKYADYQNRTQDGRIPVYNDSHSLIGTYSPMQLALRTMGIKPTTVAQEQGAAKWILSQRDKIRGYRREYLQALYENDGAKAEKIQREFREGYPELGPIQVKKSDITALRNRREISRLNRILKGLPKEARPIFQQAIGEASLGRMTKDIEMNPGAMDVYFPQ